MKNIHVLPKEEPKQLDIKELNRLDDIEIEEMSNDFETIQQQIKLKQETLEEAAHNYFIIGQLGFEKAADTERAFLRGGLWQQERSYSEEEVKELLTKFHIVTDGTKKFEDKWFEQFKKK